MERAQTVWQAALDPAAPSRPHDRIALDLLRAAHHDSATMEHALVIGRSQLAATPDDVATREGVAALDRSIAFLGVRPHRSMAL
jgi:hypothetical protein